MTAAHPAGRYLVGRDGSSIPGAAAVPAATRAAHHRRVRAQQILGALGAGSTERRLLSSTASTTRRNKRPDRPHHQRHADRAEAAGPRAREARGPVRWVTADHESPSQSLSLQGSRGKVGHKKGGIVAGPVMTTSLKAGFALALLAAAGCASAADDRERASPLPCRAVRASCGQRRRRSRSATRRDRQAALSRRRLGDHGGSNRPAIRGGNSWRNAPCREPRRSGPSKAPSGPVLGLSVWTRAGGVPRRAPRSTSREKPLAKRLLSTRPTTLAAGSTDERG